MNDFAVFILTHGRADKQATTRTLRRCGYTGEIYYIVDDEDEQLDKYISNYGSNVITFNKKNTDGTFDVMDNFHDYRSVVYARNQVHRIAGELGITHFLELDDDYSSFGLRYVEQDKFKQFNITDLDSFFNMMWEYLDQTPAKAIAMAQGGDFIGGANSHFKKGITRKVMNAFFCRTDRPFQFIGNINEDTNAYVNFGRQGDLFMTIMSTCINQAETQANKGGLSTIYLAQGTYVKSFYTVMCQPSSVKVAAMGDNFFRLHHRVDWNRTVPMILSDKWQRSR